ncbi:MAG: acyl-CoA dehydrogenase family protein [Myxococcota bacterium]|nr:acyl-CoA dehydrogenase family protein [Myxococcota bacterium]
MANFFTDNADLQYYVDKGIDWAPLIDAVEFPRTDTNKTEMIESYREVLELLGTFSGEQIGPYADELDSQEMRVVDGEVPIAPRMAQILESAQELGLHGLSIPTDLGGMNCPLMLYYLNAELMGRGDVSVMSHFGFHSGIALCLLFWSIDEGTTQIDPETGEILSTRWRADIERMRDGLEWGSMDLTEPHAGSDLANLRSRAEQDEDGNWFVTGSKIWITSGHGRYHVVIARSEDPETHPGLDGISLFLVRAFGEDEDGNRVRHSTLERVDEKLGHHGSATVGITFDRSPAELIGTRGEGFRLMLLLMNNARISVGFESIGLCEAAYRMAKAYAAERPSMGKTIDQHEMIAEMLDEMESDILGMRALAVKAAHNEELARRAAIACKALPESDPRRARFDAEQKRRTWASRKATPLLKYVTSEKAVEMARRNIQIHGGSGYMREYGAEKLLRDSLVLPIYEGTSQIQCLMAMKDNLLPLFKRPIGFLAATLGTALVATFGLGRARRIAKVRSRGQRAMLNLIRRIAWAKLSSSGSLSNWDPKKDFAPGMLHAERLAKILVDVQIIDALAEQGAKHPERLVVLDRYLERALPRSRSMLYEIQTTGDRLLNTLKTTAA